MSGYTIKHNPGGMSHLFVPGRAESIARFNRSIDAEAVLEALADHAALVAERDALRAALSGLMAAYESEMHSEYDYHNNPWTPEREPNEAFLAARAALAMPKGANA